MNTPHNPHSLSEPYSPNYTGASTATLKTVEEKDIWCCDCGRKISFPVPLDEAGNCRAGGTHIEKSKYMNAPLVEDMKHGLPPLI